MMQLSLKTKMTAAVSLLVTLLLTATALLAFFYFERTLKATISQEQAAMLSARARDIDDKIANAHNALIGVSRVVPSSLLFDEGKAQKWLNDRTGIQSIFDNGIFLFLPQGVLVAEAPYLPGRRGMDFSFRDYITETVRTGKPSIGQPFFSMKEHRHPSIMLTAPVYDRRGDMIAILAGSIDLMKDNFLGALADIRIGGSGYLYLFSTDRTLIIHPDKSRILRQDAPKGSDRLFDAACGGFEGTGETVTSNGLHSLSTFRRLRTTNWILAANYPLAEAYAPVRTARRYSALLLALSLVISIPTVRLVMARLTAPLAAFTTHVQAIHGETGRGRRIDIRTGDEIEKLAAAFNAMIGQIERQHGELRESEERHRAFIDSNLDGVYFSDQDGVFRRINSAGAQILGHGSPGELIGRNAVDYWAEPAARNRFVAVLREKGSVKGYVMQARRADGREIYLEATSRLVMGERGAVAGIEGILRDITDRTLAERALAEKTAELEKAYADLKSAKSQIFQQEKMASVGQLAAGVAHEINNPVGFIISNLGTLGKYLGRIKEYLAAQAEVIEREVPSPELAGLSERKKQLKLDYTMQDADQLIRESLDGADRVKKIVQNLKSFAMLDEAEFKMADLNAGIESTLAIVWNELKYKATVKKELGEIPPTRCNPGQLNQVFMNLLVNAAQAIETKGEITVRTGREQGSIFVTIADTGCGIPADRMNRVFEPFFTTKEVGKGTGLGLSIAYDIVKKHDGDMTVSSEINQGTTFTVRLPIVND